MQIYNKAYGMKENYFGNEGGSLFENIGNIGYNLVLGRQEYPPYIRKILKDTLDDPIISAHVHRAPIVGSKFLNIITLGKLKKAIQNTAYDELFHLRINLELQSGKVLYIEKNESIKIELSSGFRDNGESMQVSNFPKASLFDMLRLTKNLMGERHFFDYNARTSNCQDFVLSILLANNCLSQELDDFVKQHVDSIFQENNWFESLAKGATDIAAKIDTIVSGGDLQGPKTMLIGNQIKPNIYFPKQIEILKKYNENKK